MQRTPTLQSRHCYKPISPISQFFRRYRVSSSELPAPSIATHHSQIHCEEVSIVVCDLPVFFKDEDELQAFLDFVLAQYVQEGVGELDDKKLPDLLNLKYHNINDAAALLGGAMRIRETFVGFQQYLY